MTFPLVDRVRRLSFAQAAKIAAAWPAGLLLLAGVLYIGMWVFGWAVGVLSHSASFDIHVRIESWGQILAVLVLPPAAFLLAWSLLRLATRAT